MHFETHDDNDESSSGIGSAVDDEEEENLGTMKPVRGPRREPQTSVNLEVQEDDDKLDDNRGTVSDGDFKLPPLVLDGYPSLLGDFVSACGGDKDSSENPKQERKSR